MDILRVPLLHFHLVAYGTFQYELLERIMFTHNIMTKNEKKTQSQEDVFFDI